MKKLGESGSHLIIVPIVAVVLIVGGLAVWNAVKHGKLGGKSGDTFTQGYSNGCTKTDPAFTSPPLKMDDLGYIRPLGAMLDGHVTPTDHVYVGPKNTEAADSTIPVLMPADGKIVQIDRMPAEYIGDRAGTQVAPEDHRIVMQFSCRYYSIFIHVHKLAPALASKITGLEAGGNKMVNIPLKAGETMGYIGGASFDWTPIDANAKLTGFISPELYEGESWKIHTVSPYDLYTGTLKTQMEAKSWRTAAPIGGKIDYDLPGKLVGTWFREGTGGYMGKSRDRYWDGHLSVVPDYVDPTYTIVSIGNWQGKAAQFLVKGSVDPAKIASTNGLVAYELLPFSYSGEGTGNGSWRGNTLAKNIHPAATGNSVGTIAFQVQADEKLKVEKFPGKTPVQVTSFTSAAQTYER